MLDRIRNVFGEAESTSRSTANSSRSARPRFTSSCEPGPLYIGGAKRVRNLRFVYGGVEVVVSYSSGFFGEVVGRSQITSEEPDLAIDICLQ